MAVFVRVSRARTSRLLLHCVASASLEQRYVTSSILKQGHSLCLFQCFILSVIICVRDHVSSYVTNFLQGGVRRIVGVGGVSTNGGTFCVYLRAFVCRQSKNRVTRLRAYLSKGLVLQSRAGEGGGHVTFGGFLYAKGQTSIFVCLYGDSSFRALFSFCIGRYVTGLRQSPGIIRALRSVSLRTSKV